MKKDKDKEKGEVSRRDFLVGAGAVVVGGAIGAGITYPLVAGKEAEVTTVTKTVSVPTTVTKTVGDGATATVTNTVPGPTVTKTVTDGDGVEPAFEEEETFVLVPGGNAMEIGAIDSKNGKVVRVRPLHYNEKCSEEEIDACMWNLEAQNRKTGQTMTLESRRQSAPCYLALTTKKRTYSPNRILYPLQRVDWEPGGVNVNPQNRGKSKFKRISWDEATDIIASEIKRVQDTYGELALCIKADSWHREFKTVHGGAGCGGGTMNKMMLQTGDFTSVIRNADSWEGWYWGSKHVWGEGMNVGQQPLNANLLLDFSENVDMIVYQGCDWDTTAAPPAGGWPSRAARWFNHLGIKQVYISPEVNYQNASNPDKWVPVLPGTDPALQLAIIYTWLEEDTYDKDYVSTHVAPGYEVFFDYVLGNEDGVPKTPAWASSRCGVPECTIKALARKWASCRTSTAHANGGSYIRGPYSHEPARLEAIMLSMQGLGKPGVNQNGMAEVAPMPPNKTAGFMGGIFGYINVMAADRGAMTAPTGQIVAKTLVHHAILEGHTEQWGNTSAGMDVTDQFIKYTYPAPEAEGGTEFHLIWQDHACQSVCWNDGNMYLHALRSPNIEFHLIQHIWMENDCLFADILLPVNTNLEEEDIVAAGAEVTSIAYHKEPVKPLGESKSDYEACLEIAKKLEKYGGRYADLYNKYSEGKTVEEWAEFGYEHSNTTDHITWEELKERGYRVIPTTPPDWRDRKRGLIDFYTDPDGYPLQSPSGKLEFYSERLEENFPDDNERGPYPKWVVGGPGWTHDESLDIEGGAERCKKYPLVQQSNHCRWRVHPQFDDVPWLREIPTCKVKGYDGYLYEPYWINPKTASERGIVSGDIVKVYNDRGTTLGGAYVTERVIPGVIYGDHGARLDPISYEDDEFTNRETKWINRGGDNNIISPGMGISKYCWGMATSSYLVECKKVDPSEMEEWRKTYPEAFARDYDPAYGLLFNAWVEGGNG